MMITDKRMRLVKTINGLDCYVFSPSLFHMYYNDGKSEDWPAFRGTLSHKIHMAMYMAGGGYNILYLAKGTDIVSYIVYTRSRELMVEGSSRKDMFIIYLHTYPEYRKQGYASLAGNTMLHGIGLKYNNSYKTIDDDNKGSIGAAKNNGYEYLCPVRRSKFLKKWKVVDESNKGLYLYENKTKG